MNIPLWQHKIGVILLKKPKDAYTGRLMIKIKSAIRVLNYKKKEGNRDELTEGAEGSLGRSWVKLWGSKEGQLPTIHDPIQIDYSPSAPIIADATDRDKDCGFAGVDELGMQTHALC
ncbi:hypothetical protein E3N88_30589 [Mikania micrantha]|uniref:Uncharacterized protein n=1 Tax=Mikania micrantha TaxID=192012 RepID=A0A5N6MMI0_9ASTR|nr:hypothetical protein E3N88_30552 [Mikania micrantha]KAD3641365.1 hypothetical protein E3N88_30589 [Mikania micrantha]